MKKAKVFFLFLYLGVAFGEVDPEKGYVACHVPLDLWNPVLSKGHVPFEIDTVDFRPCHEIILSTETPFFSEYMRANMDSNIFENDLINLERFVSTRSRFPLTSFTLSLRSKYNSVDVETIFSSALSLDSLADFLLAHNLTGFDLAWNIIEKHTHFIPQIRRRLSQHGRKLSVTIIKEISESSVQFIASNVDSIRVIPDCNRFYTDCQDLLPHRYMDIPASDSTELGIGFFLQTYLSLDLPPSKLILGVPLDTVIWQTNKPFITDTSNLRALRAIKSYMHYRDTCDFLRIGWKELTRKENYFARTLIAPCRSVWAVQLDPGYLAKKINLLLHYGFNNFAVYDLVSDDTERDCISAHNKTLPMTRIVYQLTANKSIREQFNFSRNQNISSICIPFYGFMENCNGNFGL